VYKYAQKQRSFASLLDPFIEFALKTLSIIGHKFRHIGFPSCSKATHQVVFLWLLGGAMFAKWALPLVSL
jgi:hypothetical protein